MERSSAMPHRHSTEVMLKFRMTWVVVKMWRSRNVGIWREEGRKERGRRASRRNNMCLKQQKNLINYISDGVGEE